MCQLTEEATIAQPGTKAKLVGQKKPLNSRDLALVILAIHGKLRA